MAKRSRLDGTESKMKIRITEKEDSYIRHRAKAKGITINEYLRQLIIADKKKSGF